MCPSHKPLILSIAVLFSGIIGCSSFYSIPFESTEAEGLSESELTKIDNIGGCNWCLEFIRLGDQVIYNKEIDPKPRCWKNDLCQSGWINLKPGSYTIAFSERARKTGRIYHEGTVVLEKGRTYQIRRESCHVFCSRMKSYTVDVWMEDISTGEILIGCRQGIGCASGTAGKCTYHLDNRSVTCEPHSVPDCGALPKC